MDKIGVHIPAGDVAGKFAPHVPVWGEMAVRVAVLRVLQSAQHSVQLTAFGVGMLAFLVGFGVCWFVFVRQICGT